MTPRIPDLAGLSQPKNAAPGSRPSPALSFPEVEQAPYVSGRTRPKTADKMLTRVRDALLSTLPSKPLRGTKSVLTVRMSKSWREELLSHFRRKCFLTVGSAWKMASGMALGEERHRSHQHQNLLDSRHSAHQCTRIPHGNKGVEPRL